MTYPHLTLTRHGTLARVTLNRPDVRNAFNAELIAELTEAFTALGQDAALRAIVLAAEGKAFCAGADLNWMKAFAHYSWDENHADATRLADMLWAIYSCPVPVVARVQGDAYAGGVGLVACADIVVAADTLDAKVDEVAAAITANGPAAVRACKQLVKDVAGREITPALRDDTARRIADIRASAEGRDGVQSFLAKRKPGWLTD